MGIWLPLGLLYIFKVGEGEWVWKGKNVAKRKKERNFVWGEELNLGAISEGAGDGIAGKFLPENLGAKSG